MSIAIPSLLVVGAAHPAGFHPRRIPPPGSTSLPAAPPPDPVPSVEPSGRPFGPGSASVRDQELAMQLRYSAMAGAVRRLLAGGLLDGAPGPVKDGTTEPAVSPGTTTGT